MLGIAALLRPALWCSIGDPGSGVAWRCLAVHKRAPAGLVLAQVPVHGGAQHSAQRRRKAGTDPRPWCFAPALCGHLGVFARQRNRPFWFPLGLRPGYKIFLPMVTARRD